MSEIISQREFARRVNVSEGMIRKAISPDYNWIVTGRTTTESGRPALIYETALEEWNKSPGGIKSPGVLPKKPAKQSKDSADSQPKTPPLLPEVSAEKLEMMAKRNKSIDISTARAALQLQKEQNKLVDKDKSYAAWFEFGKMLRENLMILPARFTALIRAAQTDQEGQEIFANGIEEALRDVTTPPDLASL